MTGINILSKTNGGVVILEARESHRSGKCQKCHVMFSDFETGEEDEFGKITVKQCAICGGNVGELIEVQKKRSRWFNYFFGEWDRKRALYCMKHRDDVLPTGFREGDLTLTNYLFPFKVKRKWDEL